MEAESRIGGIELKIKRRRFDGLLFVASQTGETVGESVRYTEFHGDTRLIVSALRLHQFQTNC